MQTIRHLLKDKSVFAVEPETTVLEAARYMAEKRIGAVPVVSKGVIHGMFTERDLMTRVVVARKDPGTTMVQQVMTQDIVTAGPDTRRSECIALMTARHCRHLPVIEERRLLGTISLRDLLVEDVEEQREEVKLLAEYVQHVPPGFENQ
jgi:CBS domain-containing protein